MAQLLLQDDLDVPCCDIYPEIFKVEEIVCEFADLNNKIHYADDNFDVVDCLNGMQRVWARGRVVRELTRVIKPGGYLNVRIPNHGDIRRRLLYLITGSQSWTIVGPPPAFSPDAETPAAIVRYDLTLPNLLSALKSAGMEIESIRGIQYAKANLLLAPLALVIKLFTLLSTKKRTNFFYLREISTFASFMASFLLVLARKSDFQFLNRPCP